MSVESGPGSEGAPGGAGVWAQTGSAIVVAQLARAGFDWICLDGQHGVYDRATLAACVETATGGASRVVVRVPANDAAAIGYALDLGADAVLVPLVESADDARAAVAASFYPPRGTRSWGPLQPLWGREAPAPAAEPSYPVCWVMVETPGALARLDEILDVPGIGVVFVGPFDLSLALGTTVDELLAAPGDDAPLARVVAAARARGIGLGAFGATRARARRLRALGFEHVVVATDGGLLASAAAEAAGWLEDA